MKISVFAHDLAANPIGRLHPLLQGLQRLGHEVEVFGFLISGSEIYLPYRDKYEFSIMPSTGSVTDVLAKARSLASRATGDLVYAGKPLLTSLFPAILASGFGRRKPLLLDVEDDDVWAPDGSDTLQGKTQFYLRGFKNATCGKYGVLLHPFTSCARHITVSSRKLQNRYGGSILLHGPDENLFDPSLPHLSKKVARAAYRIPEEAPVVAFAGTPHPHKGFDIFLEGIARSPIPFHLLLCGDQTHPLFQRAAGLFGNRCHFTGFLPNDRMPDFLAAADIVPILQRPSRYAQAQMPAKILEAMAMGKWIVASRVGDLPQLLGEEGERRGWVVEPENVDSFAHALTEIWSTPKELLAAISAQTRKYYLENASVAANTRKLETILNGISM